VESEKQFKKEARKERQGEEKGTVKNTKSKEGLKSFSEMFWIGGLLL